MRRPGPLVIALLPFTFACRKPPDAPSSLDELSGYLFEHLADEDPAALDAGMDNLYAWLVDGDHLEETLGGYAVSNVSQAAADALDERERILDDLTGAAVGTESGHDVYSITDTLVMVDPEELSPGTYQSYKREFVTDEDCFMAMDCDMLQVFNTMESKYAGMLDARLETNGQYRWVETEQGTAMIQRTWLDDEIELSLDWISVTEQFYLNAVLPHGDGTIRLQAMWVVAYMGEGSVNEGLALQLVIGELQDVYKDVDAWLDEHGDKAVATTQKGGCSAVGAPASALLALVGLGLARRRRRHARGAPPTRWR